MAWMVFDYECKCGWKGERIVQKDERDAQTCERLIKVLADIDVSGVSLSPDGSMALEGVVTRRVERPCGRPLQRAEISTASSSVIAKPFVFGCYDKNGVVHRPDPASKKKWF